MSILLYNLYFESKQSNKKICNDIRKKISRKIIREKNPKINIRVSHSCISEMVQKAFSIHRMGLKYANHLNCRRYRCNAETDPGTSPGN